MNKRSRFIMTSMILVVLLTIGFFIWSNYRKQLDESRIEASGTIETDEVEVGSHVGGRIQTVQVMEGATVKTGQTLVSIEPYQIPEQREQLQAQLRQAQAQLQALREGPRSQEVAAAQAQYQAALAQARLVEEGATQEEIRQAEARRAQAQAELNEAQRQFQRMETLRQRQVISEQEFDVARTRFQVAQEQLEAVQQQELRLRRGSRQQEIEAARQQAEAQRAQLELLRAGTREESIAAQQALVESIQAQINQLNKAYRELFVTSPCPCEVSSLAVEKGQIVRPDQTVATLINLNDLWIRVFIPEERFGQVKPGDKALIKVDAYPGKVFEGRVVQVATQAEFTPRNVQTEETRKILVFGVKVAINNSEGLLRPGMPADVSFTVSPRQERNP